MTELDLRLHCLALAVKHLGQQAGAQEADVIAKRFYEFLTPALVGVGVPHNAANVHPSHPTIQ